MSPARCSFARMAPPAGCCPACAPLQFREVWSRTDPWVPQSVTMPRHATVHPPGSGASCITPATALLDPGTLALPSVEDFEMLGKIMRYLRSPAASPRPRPRPGTSAAPLQSTPRAPACACRRISVSSFVLESRDVVSPPSRYISGRSAFHRAGACGQHTQETLLLSETLHCYRGRDFETTHLSRCISSPCATPQRFTPERTHDNRVTRDIEETSHSIACRCGRAQCFNIATLHKHSYRAHWRFG